MKEQLGKTFYKVDLKRHWDSLASNQDVLYFASWVLLIVNPWELFDEFQRALTGDLFS